MERIATYTAELNKLDQLESQYQHRWESCNQALRKNRRYLKGLRWCMKHRLRLLAKLTEAQMEERNES